MIKGGHLILDGVYIAALIIILFLYALFSSMIPTRFGLSELLIGGALLFLSFKGFVKVLSCFGEVHKNVSDLFVPVTFLYLLTVPTITALVTQNSLSDMIRDIVPLFFLYVPLFLLVYIRKNPGFWLKILTFGLSFVGSCMALRHFMSSSIGLSELGKQAIFVSEGISLGHDPTVLFAAIFLLGSSILYMQKKQWFLSIMLFSAALPTIMVILAVAARAPFALLVLAIVIIFLKGSVVKGRGFITILLVLVLFAYVVFSQWVVIQGVVQLLLLKQQIHGNTVRELEIQAVYSYVTSNTWALLFGGGWGTLIAHPLAYGEKWSFVHNMFGYFLFKSGLVGLIATLSYLGWVTITLLKSIKKISEEQFIVIVAVVPPLMINTFFEVGYKTLPFGLLLTTVLVVSFASKRY